MEEEVVLNGMAYGGEAIGRLADGRAVFVPFALPGERVRVRIEEEKRGYARAALIEVLEPLAWRILPRCQHFGECGGCHYQHIPYERQLDAKREILREQLVRIGRLENPKVLATIASPKVFNYRNHIQFHLSQDGKLGFHRWAAREQAGRGDVLPVQECHLPEEVLTELWPRLEVEAVAGLERVGMRLGAEEEVQLILEGGGELIPEVTIEELPISAVHIFGGESVVLAGSEAVRIEVLGRNFRVSAGSFFQVNTRMAEMLIEHVLEHAQQHGLLKKDRVVIEAYCGVGLFSAFMAKRVGRLIGIESSPAACEDFTFNLDEFDNVELYEAPVEMVLSWLDARPDLVLVDPPRAGLGKEVVEALLRMKPPVLGYVSCDPATLGRDARRLVEGGYRLEQVTPFDLFPQTYHIESVSWWKSKV